jgi:hypothetical protein
MTHPRAEKTHLSDQQAGRLIAGADRGPLLDQKAESCRWCLAGLALLGLALVMLETAQPFYFCRDDVLACDMPPLLFACRSVWSGVVPEYNPYAFLGGPLLSEGRGPTYPPLYLSYALARHAFGNEYATMDILAILHLTAGYLAIFAVARLAGMRGMVACVVGLTFALSGPLLIMGRSWFQVLAMGVYSPLLALAAERLRRRDTSWRWALTVGILIGLYYHAGFPQLWFFGVGFFLLHVAGLVVARAIPARRALWVLPALLIGAGLVFPLFDQQRRLAVAMRRSTAYGSGVGSYLLSFLFPYPLYHGTLPDGSGSLLDYQYGGHFFYYGSLMAVLFLFALADALARWGRLVPRRRGTHVWTFCGLIAFVLCLGTQGYLWRLVEWLPMGLRNYPIRVLPLFLLFSLLSAGLVLDRWLRQFTQRRGVGLVVAGGACLILMYHVSCARSSFYNYGFHPYPALPADLLQLVGSPDGKTPYRHLFCAPHRSFDPTYPYSLPHAMPVLYELPALTGYDPLLERKPDFMQVAERLDRDIDGTLRAYGVRWVLIHRTIWQGNPVSPGTSRILECLVRFNASRVNFAAIHEPESLRGILKVGETRTPDPLCFVAGSPAQALPLRFDARGIEATLSRPAKEQAVVVNFLLHPVMKAYVDGKPTPLGKDDWLRIVVNVPQGAEKLEVFYQPPWMPGLLAGAVLATLGLATVPLAARFSRLSLLAAGDAIAARCPQARPMRFLSVLCDAEQKQRLLLDDLMPPLIASLTVYGILAAFQSVFFHFLLTEEPLRIRFAPLGLEFAVSRLPYLAATLAAVLATSLVVPRRAFLAARSANGAFNDCLRKNTPLVQVALVVVGGAVTILLLLAKGHLDSTSFRLWSWGPWRPLFKLLTIAGGISYLAIIMTPPDAATRSIRFPWLRALKAPVALVAAAATTLVLLTRPLPQSFAENALMALFVAAYLWVVRLWLVATVQRRRRGLGRVSASADE